MDSYEENYKETLVKTKEALKLLNNALEVGVEDRVVEEFVKSLKAYQDVLLGLFCHLDKTQASKYEAEYDELDDCCRESIYYYDKVVYSKEKVRNLHQACKQLREAFSKAIQVVNKAADDLLSDVTVRHTYSVGQVEEIESTILAVERQMRAYTNLRIDYDYVELTDNIEDMYLDLRDCLRSIKYITIGSASVRARNYFISDLEQVRQLEVQLFKDIDSLQSGLIVVKPELKLGKFESKKVEVENRPTH